MARYHNVRDSQGRFTKPSNSNGQQKDKDITGNRLRELESTLAVNHLMFRRQLVDKLLDTRRDVDVECGYPKTSQLDIRFYKLLYERESIATRVVEVLPQECWQWQPMIVEDEDPSAVTQFEQAVDELARNMLGTSWYIGDKGNPIWEVLKRVDILSRIGHYGILLLGLDDGKDLSKPAEGIDEAGNLIPSKDRKLLFTRPYDESLASIVKYEKDKTNPRFGQPTEYNVTLNDPTQSFTGTGLSLGTVKVHWSRVIHVPGDIGSSEVFGVPAIRPVYNRLYDLRKTYGGSAEMYWRGAFPGLAVEMSPELATSGEFDKKAMRTTMTDYMNMLQRYIAIAGGTVKSLAPQVVDPSKHIDTYITAICVKFGIPKRIFMGTERGDLASSQDESSWNDKIQQRQNTYLTPRIIIPFIDRLIKLKVLPEPVSYNVVWPDLTKTTERDRAEVAKIGTEADAKYVAGGVNELIPEMDYLVRIRGFTEEDARAIIENAMNQESDERVLQDDKEGEETEEGEPSKSSDQSNPGADRGESGGDTEDLD